MSTTEKMKTYNKDVQEIAKAIRDGFFSEDYSESQWQGDMNYLQDEEFMDKAVKIHQYFPNVKEAKKVLNFLQMANPVIGKMFVVQI